MAEICQAEFERRETIYYFYADVFLLNNLCMDYIALAGANCFLKRRKKNKRILLAACFSSLGSLFFTIVIADKILRMTMIHFLLNTVMVFLCFGKSPKIEFLENWAVTYFMVVLLGGMIEAWGSFPWLYAKEAAAAVSVSVLIWYLGRRKQFQNHIFFVEIKHRKQSMELKAFWDSGNQLKDPYTGRPVCIISKTAARELIDKKADLVRFIPYVSLGQTNGIVPVFCLESMTIYNGKHKIEIKPVEVGVAEESLLEQKEYDLILQASLLENAERGNVNGNEISNAHI